MSGEFKTGMSKLDGGYTVQKKNSKKFSCRLGQYKGLVYAVLAGAATIIAAFLCKIIVGFTAIEINFYAFFYSIPLLLPLIVWTRPKMPEVTLQNILLWILLGTLCSASGVFKRAALLLLPLGEASSIIFSIPLVTSVFARIILKDRLTWMTVLSLIVSLVGMLLTMRVPEMIAFPELYDHLNSDQHLIGCAYAIGCVISTSGIFIVMRSLRDVPALLNTFIQNLIVTIECACIAPFFGGFRHPECALGTSMELIGLAVCAVLSGICLNLAVQTEDPTTTGTVFRSTDIVIAFLIQVIFFRDAVDGYAVSGALLVFISGAFMPLQKWMGGKPEGSCWKESWLLK